MILDRTAECAATNKRLVGLGHLRYVVIHHTSLSHGGRDNPHPIADADLDGPALAKTFRERPDMPPDGLGTGGWCPYHVLISPTGRRELLMPLSTAGAHAVGYNHKSIGVALIGDFAKHPPPLPQLRAAAKTCAELVIINKGLAIGGHTTTFQNTSRDPDKVCPGPLLSIKELTARVVQLLPPNWRTHTEDEVKSLLKLGGYVV